MTRSLSGPSATFSTMVVVILSPNSLDDLLAALFVGVGPAEVADRTDEDVADLERVGGEGAAAEERQGRWRPRRS